MALPFTEMELMKGRACLSGKIRSSGISLLSLEEPFK